jgi:hypothetical protein
LYCSNTGEYCSLDTPNIRAALEDIFQTYGARPPSPTLSHTLSCAHCRSDTEILCEQVDVYISSHQHSYERLWPVVKGQVLAYHYDNLQAPFQVISGSGGCPLVAGFCFDPTFGARG